MPDDLTSARARRLLTALANYDWLVRHRFAQLDLEHGVVVYGDQAVPVESLTEPGITPATS